MNFLPLLFMIHAAPISSSLICTYVHTYIHTHYIHTRAVWKVCGLTLLLRVGTLWRCGDGLFYEVPPLASHVLLTTLQPLFENVLQTVCHKLLVDCGTGDFDLGAPFSLLEKPRHRTRRDLDCMADVLMGFHRSL
jgi:hypothetical protein